MNIVDDQINKAAKAISSVNDKEALAAGNALAGNPQSVSGKVQFDDGKVTLLFRVNGKLYPHTESNGEVIDYYLHNGDASVLDQLTDEVPF